jgi:Nucleotidyl transferase AbiEii toxin, Type IV TA system
MLRHFNRPEHETIAKLLRNIDQDFLLHNRCWFGGGTAIVMTHGEYRLSLDVDFLCSDMLGYRALRSRAVEHGVEGLFGAGVEPLRDVRADQYGIRAAVKFNDQAIKIEIVREGRISLDGALDVELGAPLLSRPDMFAEKLLANADRGQDPSIGYRDAIDLGMLLADDGAFPGDAIAKAESAYGVDIERKMRWVARKLSDEAELKRAAERLMMGEDLAKLAMERVSRAIAHAWPTSEGTF